MNADEVSGDENLTRQMRAAAREIFAHALASRAS